MNTVKLSQQEMTKMGDQMKHKIILMKMVSTISKLNLNSTMKKEVVDAKSDQQVNIYSFAVRCDQMWPSTQ